MIAAAPNSMDLLGAWFGPLESTSAAESADGEASAESGFGAMLAALQVVTHDSAPMLARAVFGARDLVEPSEDGGEASTIPGLRIARTPAVSTGPRPSIEPARAPADPLDTGPEAGPGPDAPVNSPAASAAASTALEVATATDAPQEAPARRAAARITAAASADPVLPTDALPRATADAGATTNSEGALSASSWVGSPVARAFQAAGNAVSAEGQSSASTESTTVAAIRFAIGRSSEDPVRSGTTPSGPDVAPPARAHAVDARPTTAESPGAERTPVEASDPSTTEARRPDPALRTQIETMVRATAPVQVEILRGRDSRTETAPALRPSASDLGRRAAMQSPAPQRAVPVTRDPLPVETNEREPMSDDASTGGADGDVRTAAPESSVSTSDARVAPGAVTVTPQPSNAEAERASAEKNAGQTDLHPSTTEPVATTVRHAHSEGPSPLRLDLGARLRLAVANTLVEAGRDRLLASVRDRFEAQVTVRPAHLGTVQVQVSRDVAQGGLNVLLVAAHEEAARALEEGIDELVEDLVRHRLEVNEVTVRRGEGPAHEAPRDGQQRSSAQDQAQRERREEAEARQRADERDADRRRSPFARWGLDLADEETEPRSTAPGRRAR